MAAGDPCDRVRAADHGPILGLGMAASSVGVALHALFLHETPVA